MHLVRAVLMIALLGPTVTAVAQQTPIFADSFERPELLEARLTVTPSTVLLVAAGETRELSASVTDFDGEPIVAPVSWESTGPAVVSVDQNGRITAQSNLGSAQIIARTEGALPVAVIVMVAQPATGAVLVDDDQVVDMPELVGPDSIIQPGSQYTALLSGMAPPAVDDLIVGTGELPLGGRVIAAVPEPDGVRVTLEVVGLDVLFDQLQIEEVMDLSLPVLEHNPVVDAAYQRQEFADGSVRWTLPPAEKGAVGTVALFDFDRDCDTSSPNLRNILTVAAGPDITMNRNLRLHIDYRSSLERLELSGDMQVVFELRPRLQTAFSGKIECKLQLASVPIPVGGPLALIFGGSVPLGLGFEIDGSVTLTEPVGYDLTLTAGGEFSAGVRCQPGCNVVGELTTNASGNFRPVLPDLAALIGSAKLKAALFGFLYADFEIGSRVLRALAFKPLGVKAGLRQNIDLESRESQVAKTNYASHFKLDLVGSAGATNELTQLLALLNISPPSFTHEIASTLAQSPVGTLSITPETAAPGEEVTFEVNLSSVGYGLLDDYIVDDVRLLRRVPDGSGGFTLAAGPCGPMTPSGNQTRFTCTATFTDLDLGSRTYYAFVRTGFLILPVVLEIASDSADSLTIESDLRAVLHIASTGARTFRDATLNNGGDVVSSEDRIGGRGVHRNETLFIDPANTPFLAAGGPQINDAGRVVFFGTLEIDGAQRTGLFDGPDPDLSGGNGGDTVALDVSEFDLANNGDVAAIRGEPGSISRVIVVTGATTLIGPAITRSSSRAIYCPRINDNQVIAWVERQASTWRIQQASYDGSAIGPTSTVLERSAAIVCLDMNNSGEFAFGGDPETGTRTAVYYLDQTGSLQTIATEQGNDPDSPFVDLSSTYVNINDAGVVAFEGERESAAPASAGLKGSGNPLRGIYLSNDLSQPLLAEGAALSDGQGGVLLADIFDYGPKFFNNNGQVTFTGSVYSPTTGSVNGAFLVSPAVP